MAEKMIPYFQLGKAGYNRPINRAHVNEIKKNWRDDLEQAAIVSFRDGQYWIIDHQHQTQAKYELNGKDPNILIRCDVRTGMTYEQESELYYLLNTKIKTLSFNDKLVGLIEAKDETALNLCAVVESCGYTIGDGSNTAIKAGSTAWSIFNKANGGETLKQILTLTQACWPNNTRGVHSLIMKGLVMFLYHHGDDFRTEHFVNKLGQLNPRDIVRKAITYYKQMDSKAFTQQYCMYSILVTNYNTGLHNKLIPASAPGI